MKVVHKPRYGSCHHRSHNRYLNIFSHNVKRVATATLYDFV